MGVNEALGTIDTATYTKKQLVRLPWDNEDVQSEQSPPPTPYYYCPLNHKKASPTS